MMQAGTPQSVEITDVLSRPLDMEAASNDLWVFGYGSLMWMPGFEYRVCVRARVSGWHRQFTLLSVKAWGTEEKPGLSAALHRGGAVLGLAFSIPPDRQEETLKALGKREAAYKRADVQCRLADNRTLEAFTYVVNETSGRFLSNPPVDEQVRLINQGVGPKGSSRFYLESTVGCLDAMGSGPTQAHALLRQVRQNDQVLPLNLV